MRHSSDFLKNIGGRPRLSVLAALSLGAALVLFGTALGGLVILISYAIGATGTNVGNWLTVSAIALGPLAIAAVVSRFGNNS